MLPFADEEADLAELGLDRKGQRKAS